MPIVEPLRFETILKRALWGGTRLERDLAKSTGGVPDAAESWEICDLPGNVSIVKDGPFAGNSLRQLVEHHGQDLLGRHHPQQQFPLLVKFLDANQQLSVQVHPKDPTLMPDDSMRPGKAESWYVVDADPGNQMYLGLREGIGERELRHAVTTGDFEECLHSYSAKAGDCIHLEPGTVHALGGGLLIAEIQQPSDITYRFYDWNRKDAAGKSRELHIEQSFAATNFEIGPVHPVKSRRLEGHRNSEELVSCQHFKIVRHTGEGDIELPMDRRMHVFVVISGEIRQNSFTVRRGETVVIPADRDQPEWSLEPGTVMLDAFVP